MSDLISRSEVLIAMDTWDKFGYDEHNRLIKIDRTNEEYVPYVHYEDMVKCVNDMPSAYYIDKVIEELEKEKTICFLTDANTGNEVSDLVYRRVYSALDKAIEIVKQGCVYDDVCEWKQHEKEIDVYFTECGQAHIFVDGNPEENNHVFCPYCGKKIKVVD